MKKRTLHIQNSEGFTLIEVLVGINLSFIAVTVMVMFFIFAYKFIFTISKNVESNTEIEEFIFRTGQTFSRAASINYYEINDLRYLTAGERDTLFIKSDTLNLKNIYRIKTGGYKISAYDANGRNIELEYQGKNKKTYSKKVFTDIEVLNMAITFNEKPYLSTFYKNNSSVSEFKNLVKE